MLVLVRPPDLFHPGPGFLPMHHGGPHHLNPLGNGKRKKSWTRAVFSHLQRKGLEKRFQIQKYITKPDRRQLAASLGLTDAQVRSLIITYYIFSKQTKTFHRFGKILHKIVPCLISGNRTFTWYRTENVDFKVWWLGLHNFPRMANPNQFIEGLEANHS